MRQHKVIKPLSMLCVMMLGGIIGCVRSRYGYEEPIMPRTPILEEVPERFQEGPTGNRTVVESAMELSEKYTQLSERATALQQENQTLAQENAQLQRQVQSLEEKLEQTQTELSEANGMLIEFVSELNQWKSDVLGYRNEMRQASQAQLEALLKVLEILGAEVDIETSDSVDDSNQVPSDTEALVSEQGT